MKTKNKKEVNMKILKTIIMVFIPLFFLGLILYFHIMPKNFNYFYDIGTEQDNYLSPIERISDKIIQEDINYRNLTGHLVYFEVPVPKEGSSLKIVAKIKDIPANQIISLGVKDQEEWHYK